MRRAIRRAPVAHLVGGGGWSAWSVPPGRSSWRATLQVVASPSRTPTPRPAPRWATTPSSRWPWSRCRPRRRSSGAPTRPTLAIAFWRNALSLPRARAVARRPPRRAGRAGGPGRLATGGCRGCRASFLAAHFATWIPSLSFTTVASSVALVATQPVWAALIARQRGEHIHRQTWIGHRRWRWPAPSCSPASTSRSRAGRCSATCWRWSAGCWRRPTSRWAARCASGVSTVSYALGLLRHRRRRCSSALCLVSPQELRGYDRGHLAGDRRHGGRRPAPRPHAGEPGAAQHQPHRGLRGDPLRDPRRDPDRPGRVRRDAAGRRPGRPRCSSRSEWWWSLRSDQDADADLVDPGGLLT